MDGDVERVGLLGRQNTCLDVIDDLGVGVGGSQFVAEVLEAFVGDPSEVLIVASVDCNLVVLCSGVEWPLILVVFVVVVPDPSVEEVQMLVLLTDCSSCRPLNFLFGTASSFLARRSLFLRAEFQRTGVLPCRAFISPR